MAYGAYLTLDQTKWYRDDFSDTNLLTGTVYTDLNKSTAFNLTGWTVKVRIFKNSRWGDYFNKTATIVVAANGTWSYAVAQNEMPPPGIYNVKIELSQTGRRESTLNRVELLILEGPTA